MFKEKNSKKRLALTESSRGQTLDARHQSMLELFDDQRNEWKTIADELKRLEHDQHHWAQRIQAILQELPDGSNCDAYQEAWTSNLERIDRKIALERRLANLQSIQHEIHYFERTGKILFDYYDLLDKQETDAPTPEAVYAKPRPPTTPSFVGASGAPGAPSVPGIPTPPSASGSSKNILEAFQIYFNDDPPPPSDPPAPQEAPLADKRSLVEQYMSIIEPSYIRPNFHETQVGQCVLCEIPLTYLIQDGITVCAQCGFQELLLVEQNKPIYRQPSKETSHFSYKRINHFNEWISQIQGKESTDIPEEIFERIITEIKKEKILDPTKITYRKMRDILKKLQVTKYYEHLNYILARINNQPTPNFSPELEEKLRTMFKDIQGPFLKHCPKDRKNFLSYSYVLYKFFQLLEKDEYLRFFPLLKSREKLHLQDQIWKKICAELNWEYIESI